jgi:putative transposase
VQLCIEALEQALDQGRPEMFHTDQGAPFTREACTARLQKGGVQISMEGRGRALDHVCVERLWRRVKDEAVSLRDNKTVWDARHGLARSFAFYNGERRHQALAYRTPAEVYGRSGQSQPNWRGRKIHRLAPNANVCCQKNGLENGVHLNQP